MKKYDYKNTKKNVQLSQELLKILDIDPERICSFDVCNNEVYEFHNKLNDFNEKIMNLGFHNIKRKESNNMKNIKNHLLPFVKHLSKESNIKKRSKVSNSLLPFWAIEVDSDKCSICGSCAKHCPTNAISLEQEETQVKLVFNYNLCIACGLCHKYCPENAITHENIFDPSRFYPPESILIMNKKMKCVNCGDWFLPQKQIEMILSRASIKSEKHLLSLSSHCPNCRLMAD
jgi:ferredoxin